MGCIFVHDVVLVLVVPLGWWCTGVSLCRASGAMRDTGAKFAAASERFLSRPPRASRHCVTASLLAEV